MSLPHTGATKDGDPLACIDELGNFVERFLARRVPGPLESEVVSCKRFVADIEFGDVARERDNGNALKRYSMLKSHLEDARCLLGRRAVRVVDAATPEYAFGISLLEIGAANFFTLDNRSKRENWHPTSIRVVQPVQ